MKKKLERWTAGCSFERLARLHNLVTVSFATSKVWEICPTEDKVYIRKDGSPIGIIDIEEGTFEGENDSIMIRKMIQNLVDRINEGEHYHTYKQYADAIQAKYCRMASEATKRYQEVTRALYPSKFK